MKKYLYKDDRNLIISQINIILTSLFLIMFEFFKGYLLDVAVSNNWKRFLNYSFVFLMLILLKCITFYIYSDSYRKFKSLQIKNIRSQFFDSLINRPYSQFIKKSEGEYLNLYTNQIESLNNTMYEAWYGFQQIIYETLFTFICLIYINLKLSLLILILILPSIIIPQLTKGAIQNKTEIFINSQNSMIGKFKDLVRGFETILNFNIVDKVEKIFSTNTKEVKNKGFMVNLFNGSVASFTSLISHISLIIVLSYCSYLLINEEINLTLLVAAIGLMQRLQYNMNLVTPYINIFNSVKVPLKNVDEEINFNYILRSDKPYKIDRVNSIDFENVKYSYENTDKAVINNLKLSIKDRGIYLFIGESGSGKSTAMNLLLNYYKLDSGNIFINGLENYKISNLYEIITVMRQEAKILNDTIKNNIALYNQYDDKDLENLLISLGLEKFLDSKNLDRNIKHGGINISGGEAKRINLARSILKKSEILILDEPFANIDSKNIELISDKILAIKDKYIFIVTHQIPQKIKENALDIIEFPK